MSQTVKRKNLSKTAQAIDEKIMCMGKNILYKTRFGIGQEKVNLAEYQQLRLFKQLLCYPLCEPEGKIEEIIQKKIQ